MKLDLEGNRRGEPERKQTVHKFPYSLRKLQEFLYTYRKLCFHETGN